MIKSIPLEQGLRPRISCLPEDGHISSAIKSIPLEQGLRRLNFLAVKSFFLHKIKSIPLEQGLRLHILLN